MSYCVHIPHPPRVRAEGPDAPQPRRIPATREGVGTKACAQREGLPVSSLYYWRRRLKARKLTAPQVNVRFRLFPNPKTGKPYRGVEDAGQLLHALCKRLSGERYEDLYRIVGQWVRYILPPRALPKRIPLPDSEDLMEIAKMTTTIAHSRDWTLKYQQEGRKEGLQKGKQEGQAALLERLIERKFGSLPAETKSRLASATLAQLEAWSLNILDASSIDEVFRG